MDKSTKKKEIVTCMASLEEAFRANSIALYLMYLDKLIELTNEAFADKVLAELLTHGTADNYFVQVANEVKGGGFE